MKPLRLLVLVFFLLVFSSELLAQQHHRGQKRHRGKKVVVVKRSPYRPARVVVYHPHWHPAYSYHRRWVYFPRYNLYWDNWRNHYVFWNGTAWISQTTSPPVIVNVHPDKEKLVELPEDEEDDDDIYKSNTAHQSTYKTE